jgi:hypothetical protein
MDRRTLANGTLTKGLLTRGLLTRGLLIAALLAAPVMLVPRLADAQEASVMNWRASLPKQRVAPVARRPTQTYRARRRYDPPRLKLDDAELGLTLPDLAITAPAPPDSARTKIALIGDSIAEALVAGLEADPGFQSELVLRHKTVSASGLVRDDYHDWPRALAAIIAENPDLAALVIAVGLNDRQPLRLNGQSLEPLSEPWREAYRARIDAVIAAAQKAKLPLFWVGLPIVRAPRLSADFVSINQMVRERVTAGGETYIETYENFADETGAFTATGPDIIGDQVRLRAPDGIHFTPAGQRKLAFFVDRPLRRRIADKLAPKDNPAIAALPATPDAPGPREVTISLPAPATLSLPKARPEVGETRPLFDASSATSLIGRSAPPASDPATRDLFDRGLSPEPRAGRSDDYRWR